jgi:hypothetical protein
MISWVGGHVWPPVRKVIRAVRTANDEQVAMWESFLLSSRAVPPKATGPMRWVPSLDGYRLVGSYLPTRDPSETGP